MANPSSSHHRGEGERHHRSERERTSSSRHHHRTISSTTLLLVLSLILAVLAVMLSLPSSGSTSPTETSTPGIFSALNPKRAQQLVSREAAVTIREAEVARREAELLAGAPGGILPSPSAVLCPVCPSSTAVETVYAPAQTVIKEIVKEDSLTPPGWQSPRIDEILDRELKVAERERDISKREENLNRREHDASRRESWIMEQLVALGTDNQAQAVEEEYFYEPTGKRKPKYQELPPLVVSEVQYETETKTVVQTQFVTVPPPANTRLAAHPAPEGSDPYMTASSPRTTAIEIITEEEEDEDEYEEPTHVKVMRSRPTRPPARWFGGWE